MVNYVEKQIVENAVIMNGILKKHNVIEKTQQDNSVTVKGYINGMPIYKKFSNMVNKGSNNRVRFVDETREQSMVPMKIERMPTPYKNRKTYKKKAIKKQAIKNKSLRKK
jgi:hypothetical protein